MISDDVIPSGGPEQEDCSHDEAYLKDEADYLGGARFAKCRRCGLSLRLIGGHRLKPIRAPEVINYSYDCIDCGLVTEFPGYAENVECGDDT